MRQFFGRIKKDRPSKLPFGQQNQLVKFRKNIVELKVSCHLPFLFNILQEWYTQKCQQGSRFRKHFTGQKKLGSRAQGGDGGPISMQANDGGGVARR
ncbi:hypothetical protein EYF80_015359 [Liparis tanakae]|uniref:Uncharacterized protein n=1 Tax=Liparis tanakae TaxID=230148 RepID=A0A4Z2I951_9TELE|nr:hypothetical protein EYF80_015359 [Liparis tanakae]